MPTLRVPVGSSVIHHHTRVVGANFLHAEREVKAAGEEQLSLGREIDALGPIVFLSGQSATVEQSRLKHNGETNVHVISHGSTHVAHIANLLGDERTVSEILLVGRAVRIDGERHTHLSYGERQRLNGLQACVGIKHLYAALIAEVYLCLVTDERCHLAVNAHTGVAHLKASFALRGLIFVFAAKGSMNVWRAVHLAVI